MARARCCTRWFNAFEAWTVKAGVSKAVITLEKIRHLDVDGEFACLLAPVALSYNKAGKVVNFPGIVTLTLRKEKSDWHISGMAWADR